MHAPVTALCKSKVVFSGTATLAHEGTSIPKFPGVLENSVLAATFMEFAVQFCVHCVKFGKVLFPVVKQHALHILKNISLLVERNIQLVLSDGLGQYFIPGAFRGNWRCIIGPIKNRRRI